MENTLENKAKFFAQYYGQNVHAYKMIKKDIVFDVDAISFNSSRSISKDYLLLKPLSSITDEDAEAIAIIYGWSKDNIDFKSRVLQFKIDLPCIAIKGYKHRHLLFVFDYLRSKGYAVSWMGLSVDQLTEYGWVKLKEIESC